jgi:hypothetical protein
MSDPRQHVNPGEPIRLAASQINGLNRLLTPAGGFASETAGEPATPYTWVMARNNTGSNLARWGVMAITGMEITPGSSTGATSQFERLPVVAGGTPSDTTTSWCVAVEPIPAGLIGRVAVGGVVQVAASDVGKARGSHVLWKNSTWALIRMQAGVVRGTFTAPWNKNATATVADAVNTGTTFTAKNYFANLSGSGTKSCAISYAGGEWILIAAECG